MGLAQGLYEGSEIGDRGSIGLITYMRTDSTRIADEALEGGRAFITATYGADSLPEKPNVYRTKKEAQDAHEAIRPTTFDLPPDTVKDFLKPDEWKLYKLIWERFIASQMLPAAFDVTQADIENGNYTLRASGRVLKRPGFLAVYRETPDEDAPEGKGENGEAGAPEGIVLPPLTQGETLKKIALSSEQKFTQPPAQYSEATLVKALEENGIGRPSTYATILSTLTDRDYSTKTEGRFIPSPLGRLVNGMLQKGFHDILNERYTAALEEQLDRIEEGALPWKEAVADFDQKFSVDLESAGEQMPNVKRDGVPTGESCPDCGSPLVMRFGRFGTFIGCTNYPECKYTRDLAVTPEASAATAAAPAEGEAPAEAEEIPPCELCGKPMAMRRSRFGTFLGCTGYPECKNIRKTGPKPEPPKPTGVTCPECGKGEIEEKRSKRGKTFFSCSRYPDCKYALWKKPILKPCPSCNAPFLVERVTKKSGAQWICQVEGCGYEEDAGE
jgi:DNA topoisomerase-1